MLDQNVWNKIVRRIVPKGLNDDDDEMVLLNNIIIVVLEVQKSVL